MKGRVSKFFDGRGFGFILGEDGVDYFFHISTVVPLYNPRVGDIVEFQPVSHAKGPRAEKIKLGESVSSKVIVLGEHRIKVSNIRNYGITVKSKVDTGPTERLRSGDPRRRLPKDSSGWYVWEQKWEVLYVNTYSGDTYEYTGEKIKSYLKLLDEAHGVAPTPVKLHHTEQLEKFTRDIEQNSERPMDGWEKAQTVAGIFDHLLRRL